MKINAQILQAAALGLSLGSTQALADATGHAPKAQEERCYGINSCAKTTKCSVSKTDLAAVKEAFGEKFAKSTPHFCAGMGSCSAEKGHVGFVNVPKGSCLKDKKGFLIEDKDGKRKVIKA